MTTASDCWERDYMSSILGWRCADLGQDQMRSVEVLPLPRWGHEMEGTDRDEIYCRNANTAEDRKAPVELLPAYLK